MLVEPTIVERPEQIYVGRRESITMTEFARVADHLPGMFDGLGDRGVVPAGAPFFRYRVIDMSAELVVDAGIPLDAPIEVEEPSFLDVLPAGRYATLTHIGHPDELMGVTASLLDWAQRQGLAWDMTPTPDGEVWGARLELLMTNPVEQPDMHKWQTVLLFKLAD
ncbi:GyrI-like domain-containing protein [Actinoplanes sp. NPDC051494]|uniref:GyrI-like domain-containing protein n=1 Tax=Actinoplanes sp. NPDC051494 TaxID=3363907 RepID=UPI00378F7CB8